MCDQQAQISSKQLKPLSPALSSTPPNVACRHLHHCCGSLFFPGEAMNFLRTHHCLPQPFYCYPTNLLRSVCKVSNFSTKTTTSSSDFLALSPCIPTSKCCCLSETGASFIDGNEDVGRNYDSIGVEKELTEYEDLATDTVVYKNTLRLVECSMFAAVTGLLYFLSNSFSIENYFGCFFPLPIVISSLRWGVAAGRKTMVATAMLLFVLSGPVKALTYLLTHGVVGFTMGSLWRLGANWNLSIFLCTIARSTGAMGYVFTSSFLIRENILALITINIHASLTYIFAATGINAVPSMNVIYTLFGFLWILCVVAASVVCYLHYTAWDEELDEIADVAGEGPLIH